MFLARTASVLLIAALAGCIQDGPAPGPTLPTDGVLEDAFTPELYLPESERFAEPGIKVAPDGTVYVTAPGSRSAAPVAAPVRGDTVWRSDDGGATFKRLPIPDAGFGGGDSDLAIASDGTLYQSGLWSGCVSLSVSQDKGETWRTNPLACGYAATLDDRNWIAAHGTDAVYLTFGWGTPGLVSDRRIALVKTLVEGESAAVTTASFEDNYQWPGNVAVDQRSGAVYVAYNTVDDEIVVLRSTDGGMTLEKRTVAEREGDTFDSFGVVAVGRDGTVYVTWSERDRPEGETPTRTDVFYSHSTDGATSWSAPIRINSFEGTHIYPWLDAGDAGRLVVAWYGTEAKGEIAEKVNGSWNVYLADSRSANTASPVFVESVVSAKPITHGSICTSGTGCPPGTRALLDYFQVVLDPQGVPHVAWATRAWQENPTATGSVMLAYAKQLIP